MKRAFNKPVKETLWNTLPKCRTLLFSPKLLLRQTAVNGKLHTCVSKEGRKMKMPANCRVSSARLLNSDPVVSPGDIRSLIPDLNIPMVSFPEFIFKRCDQFTDAVAVTDRVTRRQYTYRELKKYSIRVASALHKQGYRKGDVFVIFTTNLPEFSILSLAASCLGVVVCLVNPAYRAAELSHVLTQCGASASAIFTIPQLMPIVQDAIADPDLPHKIKAVYTFGHAEQGTRFFNDLMEDDGKAFPENVDIDPVKDTLVLPFSSGTTGMPKGVMLSHHNLVANIMQFRERVRMRPEDNIMALLPFFHIYGFLPIQFCSIYDGAHMVTMPRFEPEMFVQTIQDEKISLLHLVPPMALLLAKHPMVSRYNLSSVQHMICGAAPLGGPLTKECEERVGAPLYQGYGLTEGLIFNMDCRPGHVGTVGVLLPNTQAKFVNTETGEPVAVGEMGEYCMKGPQRMLGYHNNQKATDDMIDGDGWLHTGDLGYIREDGLVVIADRLKELIKYKGLQVAPAELESVLLTHPAVQDVGVIGVPDEEAGELPKAFVVLKHNVTDVSPQAIAHFVEKKVSPFKKLRGGVQFVDEIPKTQSGKILRRVLRENALHNK